MPPQEILRTLHICIQCASKKLFWNFQLSTFFPSVYMYFDLMLLNYEHIVLTCLPNFMLIVLKISELGQVYFLTLMWKCFFFGNMAENKESHFQNINWNHQDHIVLTCYISCQSVFSSDSEEFTAPKFALLLHLLSRAKRVT